MGRSHFRVDNGHDTAYIPNNILQHIDGIDSYISIWRLHEPLDIEYCDIFVIDLGNRFFNFAIQTSTLTVNIADI